MTEKEKKEVEAQIKKEIKKTKNTIAEYKELTKPIAPENAIGRVSRMDAINNKSVTEAALRTAEEKLKGLKFMLEKINDKDFGQCARCKNPIPIPRMLYIPQSRFCVNCAK